MNVNKMLFQDIYCTHKDIILVAGELLNIHQFEMIFKLVLYKYNIKNYQDYKNTDPSLRKEIIEYACDLFDYYLLNPFITKEYQLSLNDCCVVFGLYKFCHCKRKTFSPESLNAYISELYKINEFFIDAEYLNSTKNIIKKFVKIEPFQKNKKQNEFIIFPLFLCSEIPFKILNETVTNYIITKEPDLTPVSNEINHFLSFMNISEKI